MSLRFHLAALLIAVCVVAPATALAQSGTVPNPAPAHPELRPVFDQFGGEAGITALVDDFMDLMMQDPRLQPFFEFVDRDTTKKHLTEQFCVILGGPCAYTGRDMKEAHALMGVDRADFNALVEVLQIAMQRKGIPFRAQNKLLQHLAPMHREIISK